ncbi:MAG: radical SAM family heme chaperone HemW [Rhodospirillaceae bacterium]
MVPQPFALYIHWPFCLSKCPYCDFNSHVAAGIDQERWRAAYLAELDHLSSTTTGRPVVSVFFGGGTPSLMPPATVGALLERIARHWPLAPDLEVTIEANPTSVEAASFAGFRAAGVNRLSLGVQALNDRDLHALGRHHSVAEAVAALKLAASTFPRYSFDLIYARPGQSPNDWRTELTGAVDLAGDHVSAYQLTIEPGTAFEPRHARGELVLPDEDTAVTLYETTAEILEAAGLPAYEISNHARPGAESRHNLVYWRGGDYAGIGPGAHGRMHDTEGRLWAGANHRSPGTWLAAVDRHGHGGTPLELIDRAARLEERLMMGLRLREGIERASIRTEFGRDLTELLEPRALARMIDGGFLELDSRYVRATAAGRQRLNAVLAVLV